MVVRVRRTSYSSTRHCVREHEHARETFMCLRLARTRGDSELWCVCPRRVYTRELDRRAGRRRCDKVVDDE